MAHNFKIIITTRDSARWLGSLLPWYRRLNYAPLFVVDARTTDETRDIIAQFGCEYKEFLPRGDFPEAGMLEFGAQQSNSDWILRLDDDELPSERLLLWAGEVGTKSKNQCWFFPRRELFSHQDKIFYSRSFGKYPLIDHAQQLNPMARLYNRNRVKFLEELHTTGFEEVNLYNFAPSECFIVHLNCIIRSFQERLNKIRSYEVIKPGSTWQLADEYLPELFPIDFHRAEDDSLSEFSFLLEAFKIHDVESDLTQVEWDLAIDEVKLRARLILREQTMLRLIEPAPAKHVCADDVAWIDGVRPTLRRPLAKLLSTMNKKKGKKYSDALWNYISLTESH